MNAKKTGRNSAKEQVKPLGRALPQNCVVDLTEPGEGMNRGALQMGCQCGLEPPTS
jgi:hypothetical protein